MKKVSIHTGFAILLFILGFMSNQIFVDFSVSLLDIEGIYIVTYSMRSHFIESLIFGAALGIIPFILLIVSKVNRSLSGFQHNFLIPVGLIALGGCISWLARVLVLNYQIKKIKSFRTGESMETSLAFEILNFSSYLLFGFVLGGILSILILKKTAAKKLNTKDDIV